MTVTAALVNRVEELRKVFNLRRLESRGETAGDIKRYYLDSRIGYRLFHSREGSIHMSLSSNGKYQPTGVYRVVDLIQERFPDSTRRVLELGAGNGFNINCLARRTPDVEFLGIDLLPRHVRAGNKALSALSNARMQVGDFEAINFADNRFDVVFAVESLCHARDIGAALQGIARILQPTGRLIVVDAWRLGAYSSASPEVKYAVELTERAMSVGHTLTQGEWIDRAQQSGLELEERISLKHEVMPNLERFEKASALAVRRRQILMLANKILPSRLTANIVAGYLMAQTVRDGLHSYDLLEFSRET